MDRPLHVARQDAVLTLTLNRPECRNALSADLIARLHAALAEAQQDPRVRCVLLTGAPPAFCAGLDLQEMAAALPIDPDAASAGDAASVAVRPPERAYDVSPFAALLDLLTELRPPLVAAVNGPAVAGGATLALLCDVVVCAASARLGFPGVRHGLVAPIVIPALVRAAGERHARYLLLTGELIGAEQAVAWSLADEAVPEAALESRANALARRLSDDAPEAVQRTKSLLRDFRASDAGRTPAWRAAARRVWLTSAANQRLHTFLEPP